MHAWLFLFISLLLSPLQAYWEDISHADWGLDYHVETYVYADGRAKETRTERMTVLTEAGQARLEAYRLTYDGAYQRLPKEHIKATVTYQGKTYSVDPAQIEIKPQASDPHGLSTTMQVLIPFTHVRPGSVLTLAYVLEDIKPMVPHSFTKQFFVLEKCRINKINLRVVSEQPLRFKIHDPDKRLKAQHQEKDGLHTLCVTNTSALYYTMRGENPCMQPPLKKIPHVSILSGPRYHNTPSTKKTEKVIAQHYEAVIKAKKPKELKEWIQKARLCKTRKEQIESALVSIIENHHYLGSWCTTEGFFMPRSLDANIASTYGDCKDKAVLLVCMLRALGFEAYPAWVWRAPVFQAHPALDNSFFHVNHAIVKAISPEGKTYWLDPTNGVAMATAIFPDIENRPCWIIKPEGFVRENVPANTCATSQIEKEETVMQKKQGLYTIQCRCHFQGAAAHELTFCRAQKRPLEDLQSEITQNFFPNKSFTVKDFQLQGGENKCVEHASWNLQVGIQDPFDHLTNCGPIQTLGCYSLVPFSQVDPNKDVGDLHFRDSRSITTKRTVKGMKIAGDTSHLTQKIETPWVTIRRDFKNIENGVHICTRVERLVNRIPNEELKSQAFLDLQKQIREWFQNYSVVLERMPSHTNKAPTTQVA